MNALVKGAYGQLLDYFHASLKLKNLSIRSSRGNEALFCSFNCEYQSLVTSAATCLTGC